MQHLDIVFFAIVAVVLGWKLFSVLGRRTGHERRIDPLARPDPKDVAARRQGRDVGRDDSDAPVQIASRRPSVVRPDVEAPAEPARDAAARGGMSPRDRRQIEADIARAPDAVRAGLDAIAKADPAFNPADFIGGAKIAFDMIVQGFAAGETKMLQSLLGRDLYESFAAVIADRQRQGYRQKTVVIGITQAQIVGAELKGKEARVTMKFVSEQTSVTEDSSGNAVEGDANHVDSIVDIWTFARDTGSRDPNWQLVLTDQPS
ncbi:Tim44/TimA family putative adaptor protein [Dongia sp.]|uniref:Tim44/TimA family putative adaptor protein n=1 Tax=Dongia sp. TaxID=1977262 RepID=UPI0035B1E354